jgi:hypothetical protein
MLRDPAAFFFLIHARAAFYFLKVARAAAFIKKKGECLQEKKRRAKLTSFFFFKSFTFIKIKIPRRPLVFFFS